MESEMNLLSSSVFSSSNRRRVFLHNLTRRLAYTLPCFRAETLLARYRSVILLLTFLAYTSYHMSRKPISVVKTKLLQCPEQNATSALNSNLTCSSFIHEMDGKSEADAKRLEGYLDSAYLFSYAFFMFVNGAVAERVDLRYFLSLGMILSGLCTIAFGLGQVMQIHTIAYYIVVQVICGVFQSTGWPGVVTVVANWFGHGKKGLIFGIWNSHTSVGNILGSLLAGLFVETSWALSFIVPGLIIAAMGLLLAFVLVPRPEDVDLMADAFLPPDSHRDDSDYSYHHHNYESDFERTLNEERESAPLLSSEEEPVGMDGDVHSRRVEGQRGGSSDIGVTLVHCGNNDEGNNEAHAITIWGALLIPGVVEFALCLFFAKLVSYTFLFWLPSFIFETGLNLTSKDAAFLSTLFDIGGIFGGILAGYISDKSNRSACTCALMLLTAIPTLYLYDALGKICPLDFSKVYSLCNMFNVLLLFVVGLLVNGPYALITTAVSAELGSRDNSAKALATVTALIDGTGSVGAALGPLLAGAIPGLDTIFYMLMIADVLALLLLSRLVKREVESWLHQRQRGL